MADRLFEGSWYTAWNNQIERAVAEVDKLDRRLFSDPALGGALQKIVQKYSVEIARLDADPEAIAADPVEEEGYVNDYGMERRVTLKWLRVTIPFSGEAESLKVAPSHSTVIFNRVEISDRSVTITVADDDNADREVRSFCDQVQGNLDALRQDYERDRPQLEQAVSRTAERRKAQIAADTDRDSKRSFTVRR